MKPSGTTLVFSVVSVTDNLLLLSLSGRRRAGARMFGPEAPHNGHKTASHNLAAVRLSFHAYYIGSRSKSK